METMEGTVLIIDDDAGVRKVLRRILSGAGYEVEEASDAFQGLDELDANPPDAALLDIKMPGYGRAVAAGEPAPSAVSKFRSSSSPDTATSSPPVNVWTLVLRAI